MTYESMHTIPNWDTHEANCDTDDPNRETYHPHNPRDRNNSWPWWPQGLYKGIENLRIRHSDHHQVHPVYLHKKIYLKNVSKGKKATQKRIPPPPDDDSEGSDIEVSQSNPAKKKKQYSKPKHPTPAVSDENKSDDASSSHSTSNILPSLKPNRRQLFLCQAEIIRTGWMVPRSSCFLRQDAPRSSWQAQKDRIISDKAAELDITPEDLTRWLAGQRDDLVLETILSEREVQIWNNILKNPGNPSTSHSISI